MDIHPLPYLNGRSSVIDACENQVHDESKPSAIGCQLRARSFRLLVFGVANFLSIFMLASFTGQQDLSSPQTETYESGGGISTPPPTPSPTASRSPLSRQDGRGMGDK